MCRNSHDYDSIKFNSIGCTGMVDWYLDACIDWLDTAIWLPGFPRHAQ